MRANPVLLLPLLLLVACGGGGGGGGTATTPTPIANQSLSGRVSDGYISGATVCLDLNSNGVCDAGEPVTTTDANGAYTLSFSGGTSLTGLNVIASVPTGAVDSDAPGTPITAPFGLAAPAAANVSGVLNLNPLLSLVAARMHADSALTTATATTAVLNLLGLPTTLDPKADYLAGSTANASLHYVNQMLAAVMQNLNPGQPLTTASLATVLQAAAPYASQAYAASNPAAAATIIQAAVEASAAGALIASVPAPTYANADALAVANSINTLRGKLPVGLLSQVTALDTAASNHALYLQGLGFMGDHTESSSVSGYTGATPAARATYAGYATGSAGENIVLGASSGADCFAALENSVYHLTQLLAPFLNVGVAFDLQPSTGSACVVTLGNRTGTFGQYAPAGTVGVYPANGQTGVPPTYYNQYETPNPLPSQAGAGHAVVVTLYSLGNTSATTALAATDVVVSSFTLVQGTTPVAMTVLAAPGATSNGTAALTADANLPGNGFLVGVPSASLTPNTRYTASFSGTVKGTVVSKTWSFTTGAQN